MANANFYDRVAWALDISEGEFKELDIRGIPAHLIRRDPETQFVLTREKALQGRWRDLEFQETVWYTWIAHFLKSGDSAVVLIAPKRHRKFLQLLRAAGVAENQ
jgi:hypothetical protein